MAGPTRLELATSGVTGRRSNQLNYDPVLNRKDRRETEKRKTEEGSSNPRAVPRAELSFTVMAFVLRSPLSSFRLSSDASVFFFRLPTLGEPRNGRYRIRTCDSRRVKPVLYH